jgi:hypothetical protein
MTCQSYTTFDRLAQQLLVITVGDAASIEILATQNGSAVNLTGFDAWMTFKTSRQLPDSAAVLALATGQGMTIISPTQGRILATIDTVQSLSLQSHYTLFFDVRVKNADGAVFSVAEGRVFIRQPATLNAG